MKPPLPLLNNSSQGQDLSASTYGFLKPQVLESSSIIKRLPEMLEDKVFISLDHEVIDLDDEDSNADTDVAIIHANFDTNNKGKGIYHLSDHQVKETFAGQEIIENANKVESNFPSSSHSFIDLDNYDIAEDDTCISYDETVDKYSALPVHFNHMDIPTDIEASIRGLPHLQNLETSSSFADPVVKPASVNHKKSVASHFWDKLHGWAMFKSFDSLKHRKKHPDSNNLSKQTSLHNMPDSDFPGYMDGEIDISLVQGAAQNPANVVPAKSTSPTVSSMHLDTLMGNFERFKQFDSVEDHSDHYYTKKGFSMNQAPKKWSKKIQDDWKILEKGLPETIFVRVYESRMDLMRAVIIGAEGTPYHDGLFFFDIFFPKNYPDEPPKVHYHSGGLRLNPNLYNGGKVCLSLLNTWSGRRDEMWIPDMSTMLQVLVSIQGLILNSKPYFNEPGYENENGSVNGEDKSQRYNEDTFLRSLKTMMYNIKTPPKHYEDFVKGHFFTKAHDILVACKAYTDGTQVGSVVKDEARDLNVGNKSSKGFQKSLNSLLSLLVDAFKKIGVDDCEKFMSTQVSARSKCKNATEGRHGKAQLES